VCLACLCVGSALGAAWRRAETRAWREIAANWKWKARNWESIYLDLKDARYYGLPEHELPMSCQLGSRPSESVRREGPTVARTLDQLMEER
jgi:hypothetical protein